MRWERNGGDSGTIDDPSSSSANHGAVGGRRSSTPFFVHVSTFRRKYGCGGGVAIPTTSCNRRAGKNEEKRGMNERCIKHQSKPVKASRLQKGTERDKKYVKKWKWERGRSRSTGLLLSSDDRRTSESNYHQWYDRPYIAPHQTVQLSRLGDTGKSYDTLWIVLSFSTSVCIQFFQAL